MNEVIHLSTLKCIHRYSWNLHLNLNVSTSNIDFSVWITFLSGCFYSSTLKAYSFHSLVDDENRDKIFCLLFNFFQPEQIVLSFPSLLSETSTIFFGKFENFFAFHIFHPSQWFLVNTMSSKLNVKEIECFFSIFNFNEKVFLLLKTLNERQRAELR